MILLHEWLGLLAFIITLSCLFAVAAQRDALKIEAVKRGAAEWVVDPNTGSATFQWK